MGTNYQILSGDLIGEPLLNPTGDTPYEYALAYGYFNGPSDSTGLALDILDEFAEVESRYAEAADLAEKTASSG